MKRPEQCDCLSLASSKAGNDQYGVPDAILDRKALVLVARPQGQDGLTLLRLF